MPSSDFFIIVIPWSEVSIAIVHKNLKYISRQTMSVFHLIHATKKQYK